MKVILTATNVGYACQELAEAFRDIMPEISQTAYEFGTRNDDRTLIVVRNCPCCSGSNSLLETKNSILVSPLKGIDPAGYTIHTPAKKPPFRNPGKDDEAESKQAYLAEWKATIEAALKA